MSANKDQKPTPRRLREARKRGDVVFSSDVSSTTVFAMVVAALWLLGATSFGLLRELWLHAVVLWGMGAGIFTLAMLKFHKRL